MAVRYVQFTAIYWDDKRPVFLPGPPTFLVYIVYCFDKVVEFDFDDDHIF